MNTENWKFCPSCGKEIENNDHKFCPYCGKEFNDVVKEYIPYPVPYPVYPVPYEVPRIIPQTPWIAPDIGNPVPDPYYYTISSADSFYENYLITN